MFYCVLFVYFQDLCWKNSAFINHFHSEAWRLYDFFLVFFAGICNLEEFSLLAESQSQSLDFGQSELTVLIKNRIDGHIYIF